MEPSAGRPSNSTSLRPLRYLSSAQVDACLPDVGQRVALARRALVALAGDDAELPPKIGVHPRPGALLHAMPGWLRGADLVGVKWVSAFPGNTARGLPAISGLVVLNDAETGVPTWIMDAARITAVRTAAVSGVAIDLFAAPDTTHVALLGAGVQARSHLEMIGQLLPGAKVALYDRRPERGRAFCAEVNAAAKRELARAAETVEDAARDAQVVITVATLGAEARRLGPDDVARGALVIAVDFATYVAPELAAAARVFAVDDRAQFLHYRDLGYFDGYPEPTMALGAPGDAARAEHDDAPLLVTHLGVGLADVVFADAIAGRALELGVGLELAR